MLRTTDYDGLLHAARDPDVWRWFPVVLSVPENLNKWMTSMLDQHQQGVRVPFTIRDATTHEIIGSTSYMHIAATDLCLEIGTTWMDKTYHGSGVNFNMKYLLLRQAFEEMGYYRVEFRTDVLNVRSRKAIEKLGAVQEGIFRNHRFNNSGGRRDSVIYSIIREEWPSVQTALEEKINP